MGDLSTGRPALLIQLGRRHPGGRRRGMNEAFYERSLAAWRRLGRWACPYRRRLVRFLALPYCYLRLVDWRQCRASRVRVLLDLLYIFFRLKYFPGNYSPCRLWEKERRQWVRYYGSGYDAYQRARLQREVRVDRNRNTDMGSL